MILRTTHVQPSHELDAAYPKPCVAGSRNVAVMDTSQIGVSQNLGVPFWGSLLKKNVYIYMVPPPKTYLLMRRSLHTYHTYIYIRIYVEYNVYAYPLCGILPFQTNFISIWQGQILKFQYFTEISVFSRNQEPRTKIPGKVFPENLGSCFLVPKKY